MFQQTFKNIDDILWKDAGCSTELDYAEQSSWILFLKWLDDYDKDKQTKAKLENKKQTNRAIPGGEPSFFPEREKRTHREIDPMRKLL